jgi:O-acetyl-ADP-ribose deacetylase (regulator of RNase III)
MTKKSMIEGFAQMGPSTFSNAGGGEASPSVRESPSRGGSVVLRSGDVFESGAHTIVITVNCVGVMGKGIALAFKKRYPELFDQYVGMCKSKEVRPGRPAFIRRLVPPSFVMFPTKDHWRSKSRLADIEDGLAHLAANYRKWGIESLAVPPLGCGLGGLQWGVVGPALYRGLQRLDVPVYLYVPRGVEA